MTAINLAGPDVTLKIGVDGVIQSAVSSDSLAEEGIQAWQGRSWNEIIEAPAHASRTAKGPDFAGATSCFQVAQWFPSGRRLPIEFTTISLGDGAGFVALGRNLQAISDLQGRLLQEQRAREQDYWRIREIETRYRLLFDASNEAVLLVRLTNLRIVEANLAATKVLGLLPGTEFHLGLQLRDRKSFEIMLDKVREQGRAPGIVLHLGRDASAWSLRASLMNSETGSYYLFQIAPIGAASPLREKPNTPSLIETIIQRIPDGFAIVDPDGMIQRANATFLDLVQIGAESAVINQNMKRWLSRPGADLQTLLSLAQSQGSVRSLATTLTGELGSNTEVEISAVGDKDIDPDCFGMLLRDVTMRLRSDMRMDKTSEPRASVHARDDDVPLEKQVKSATEAIERHAIKTALERAEGNRTVAARQLGLSRQSLHTKLNKYDLNEDENA
jgi:transcriptional regulator PpsR